MIYKIGIGGKLELEDRRVLLSIPRRVISIVELIIGSLIFGGALFLVGAILFNIKEKEQILIEVSVIALGVSLWFCYYLLSADHSDMDLTKRRIVTRKKIGNIVYKSSSISWPGGCVFKYSVNYDSYSNINEIWLEAGAEGKKDNRKLLCFFDKETFLDFQKIFNQHFPENKIMEWHD